MRHPDAGLHWLLLIELSRILPQSPNRALFAKGELRVVLA